MINRNLPEPSFIERDPDKIIAEQKAYYESLTGKSLEPAQIEMLLINGWAYRELLIRNGIQSAGKQSLVRYATFPMLDYIGEMVGVTRLAPSSAETQITFTLVPGHGDIVIPVGLRVQSNDGLVVFQLVESISVATGVDTATGIFQAQVPGKNGNGYTAGNINIILDPQPYLSTAVNSTTSDGGSDEETDDELRERIYLAPSSFSCAGPTGAYKYWARTAHPSIMDVGIKEAFPAPGSVSVYPLSTLAIPTPTAVLDAVNAVLTGEKIRPINDNVVVASPTQNTYAISVNLTLVTGANQTLIESIVTQALTDYANSRKKGLGLDVVVKKIEAIAHIDGVYEADVVSPLANIVADEDEVNVCTGITVTTTGTHDE